MPGREKNTEGDMKILPVVPGTRLLLPDIPGVTHLVPELSESSLDLGSLEWLPPPALVTPSCHSRTNSNTSSDKILQT